MTPRVKQHGFLFYCGAFFLVIFGLWKFSDFEEDAKSKKHSKRYREWEKEDAERRKREGKKPKKYTAGLF
ncbi:Hypothetical predicted protein [Lecanosticta acicola]|uniref:Uncharacterized protein n=1 Tax=Lecanosticta acicola TaxID=111012 RepID=A0AAI9E9W7_9PEZI|nr:Hypothetical predicted protein [Lecanosticta acicola]